MTFSWSPSQQTEEARAALRAFVEATPDRYRDPHDPEMLMCLDKGDIVSRYQLLVQQSEARRRSDREHYDSELARLRKVVAHAAKWWDHCLALERQGRKTARLAEMKS